VLVSVPLAAGAPEEGGSYAGVSEVGAASAGAASARLRIGSASAVYERLIAIFPSLKSNDGCDTTLSGNCYCSNTDESKVTITIPLFTKVGMFFLNITFSMRKYVSFELNYNLYNRKSNITLKSKKYKKFHIYHTTIA
jgi:hypothetical protein